MIQRPQTVYLLAMLALLLMAAFAELPFYSTQDESGTNKVTVHYGFTDIQAEDGQSRHQNTALFSLLAVSAVIALIAILSFKNRKLQASMIAFNFGALMGILGLMYMFSFYKAYFEHGSESLEIWVALPLFLLFFNYLALRGVRRDQQLIRSMDRFR